MKKQLLLLLIIFCCAQIQAQSDDLWQKVSSDAALSKRINMIDSDKLYYKLNAESLQAKLSSTTNKSSKSTTTTITIPNAKGGLERFQVWESSNFEPELQAKYPEIRAYEGNGLDDKTAKIHFSVAPIGMQTMVIRADKPTEFIEQNPEDKTGYVLFTSNHSLNSTSKLVCGLKDVVSKNNSTKKAAKTTASNKVFKTLRLALSCTGEYTAFFGGTKAGALAGMNASMTRVNGVFNKDLAVQLILIANNDAIIYTNAATDPYSKASDGTADYPGTSDYQVWNIEAQNNITSVIGEANYDIGHLFGASGGGGNAGCIGCICSSPPAVNTIGKGSAYTSPSNGIPQGDSFDIDFVAHELGHQLGATHTFSYSIEGTGTSVEPGSGSTLMGYAGITDYDVQNNSDDYFAYASILQIQENLATLNCPVSTPLTNNPPTISAGLDYTIPISTAFVLKGSGSDPDGDTVTYTWEENDSATTTDKNNSIAYAIKPDGPMFRSLRPTSSPIRYMPSYDSVLQNKLTTTWESVSDIARTLNFTLTGRDNAAQGKAQTYTDAMVVTVASFAGPFAVTSHKDKNVSWTQGLSQTITWSVNNTNTLFGSSTVNIKLSTDEGLTFPVTLATNTPNDGSEVITLPASVPSSKNCRILIEPVSNIYYALNSTPFAIGYTSKTTCDTYSFGNSFTIPYSTTYTSKTITVPASTGVIEDVNVSINVTHDRLSDLEIQIINPQGTAVRLFNKACTDVASTLVAQFDDDGVNLDCSKTTSQIVLPVDALNVFNGQNPQGTWTFRVRDAVLGKFGTINSASINICSQTFTLGTEDFNTIDFVLYPNPSKGNFTVQFESDATNRVQVYVHDILGKKVYSNSFDPTSNFDQNIQLPQVSAGIYLVTVIDGDRRTVKKIVVN
ncbi:putative secreted protein (Por secretion system target) [Flavobacterium sp. 9]|uniref:zinc-dependent metalloprotease n=1 Tax=Flavobacterium sp. 9 TaxID=2035198 RepID=UPI000C17F221|nr:zinc-dependent metalloprotease family protein [Flavobacterium sp. 9]PIF31864.1 putative secreted protein (Por secretion system target) [Flavobacterium sp. 9]